MLTSKAYIARKEKNRNFQSVGIIAIKSSETREAAYTCRYTSGHLIPIPMTELGIIFVH